MNGKINWLKNEDGDFVKTERDYLATISLETTGEATLTVTYDGSPPVALPTPTTYPTIKYAKQAFRVYLRDVAVTAV